MQKTYKLVRANPMIRNITTSSASSYVTKPTAAIKLESKSSSSPTKKALDPDSLMKELEEVQKAAADAQKAAEAYAEQADKLRKQVESLAAAKK